MARDLISILDTLEHKIEELQTEMEELRQRNAELEQLNVDLQRKETNALKAKEQAILDAEYLKVSHRLAESPDSLVETRKIIAGLIRNIDRCIEMLRE